MHLDFETYSAAGQHLDLETGKWSTANTDTGGTKRGIALVGAFTYAAHPSTEVLVACFGDQTWRPGEPTWRPGEPNPEPLLQHVRDGGLIYAYNSFFEWCVWNLVCTRLYGWPPLPISQTRDTMAQAVACSLPSALGKASAVLNGESKKQNSRVMRKLAQPRNATKLNKSLRYTRDDSEDWKTLDAYCLQDVEAEADLRTRLPQLSPQELEVWLVDQKINSRGIRVDMKTIEPALRIMREAKVRAGLELSWLTQGKVSAVSQATAILNWVNENGPELKSLTEIEEYLELDLPDNVRKVLELRLTTGGSAPAKLVAMKYMAAPDHRVRGVYQYHGAQRTGRWAGRGIQTQNMPSFSPEDIPAAISEIRTGEYDQVSGNPAKTLAGCLRAMLIPAEGHDFICSDYSAIEAVVMACMAGEQWIIDVFNGDGKLYERTAEKITGEPCLPDGTHPKRKLGKVASLASQYQGAKGAWKKFGAERFLSDQDIKDGVRRWRDAAPNIVQYWHDLERDATAAIRSPRQDHGRFRYEGGALYCTLPSGRRLTYIGARIENTRKLSADGWKYTDMSDWASEEEMRDALGPIYGKPLIDYFYEYSPTIVYDGVGVNSQWVRLETYGGKLSENITQAVARDILAHALVVVENAGYPIVMHTHDEIVAEVPEGYGSVEELERLMGQMPAWATGWPIHARGGWRGKYFKK